MAPIKKQKNMWIMEVCRRLLNHVEICTMSFIALKHCPILEPQKRWCFIRYLKFIFDFYLHFFFIGIWSEIKKLYWKRRNKKHSKGNSFLGTRSLQGKFDHHKVLIFIYSFDDYADAKGCSSCDSCNKQCYQCRFACSKDDGDSWCWPIGKVGFFLSALSGSNAKLCVGYETKKKKL